MIWKTSQQYINKFVCLCCETEHDISWSPVIILFKTGEEQSYLDLTTVKYNNNKLIFNTVHTVGLFPYYSKIGVHVF
jgi:hypothetical protein